MKISIIYHDLSVVRIESDNDEKVLAAWLEAPSDGVQFFSWKGNNGELRGAPDHGWDYYYLLRDVSGRLYPWGCNDLQPQLNYLKVAPDLNVTDKEHFYQLGFKSGLTVSDEQFEECRNVHAKEVEWLMAK